MNDKQLRKLIGNRIKKFVAKSQNVILAELLDEWVEEEFRNWKDFISMH